MSLTPSNSSSASLKSATSSPLSDTSLKSAISSPASGISLKFVFSKKADKVVFVEAGKEFVDHLFQILALPVGTIIGLLKNDSMVGSLGNLYTSIENLENRYLQPSQIKDRVLNPKIAVYGARVPKFLSNDDVSLVKKLYTCSDTHHGFVADDPTVECKRCRYPLSNEVSFVSGPGEKLEGGFVKEVATYAIMDDLEVIPTINISNRMLLDYLKAKGPPTDLEQIEVMFGIKEGLLLLKASLETKNVFTTVLKGYRGEHNPKNL